MKKLTLTDVRDYGTKKAQLVFPLVSSILLKNLCQSLEQTFKEEPVCLELKCDDIIIIGDIHGHILDLFRILAKFGFPPQQKYLFLGDLVDRGPFSLETIVLVFTMKYLYPNHIYIVRGNHEFEEVCARNGFLDEALGLFYDASIFKFFVTAFSYIPLAAIINDKILCAHGGIGPNLESVDQIKSLQRPITDFSNKIVATLLWSDPLANLSGYELSHRGIGYLYGNDVLDDFLNSNHFDLFIRGHECVGDGVEFHGKGITVFSASEYCGATQNMSGVLKICSNGKREAFCFQQIPYLNRSDAIHEAFPPLPKTLRSSRTTGVKIPPLPLGKKIITQYNTSRSVTNTHINPLLIDKNLNVLAKHSNGSNDFKIVDLGKASFRIARPSIVNNKKNYPYQKFETARNIRS
ncbi:Ser/Thr protein phosphatase [Histomonas meleagridis]|uniref:Ser/Thr protein phosphatase n=1 Tax=Histomonas meleagridis TaxID=135588 RepID=UPI00355A1D7F|nr:Ser/Thr protein phosphatase [Histomonas meleagridis]KAH0799770.1 Ser/Thr protein phosphatase [Histomonas meleagridis]